MSRVPPLRNELTLAGKPPARNLLTSALAFTLLEKTPAWITQAVPLVVAGLLSVLDGFGWVTG